MKKLGKKLMTLVVALAMIATVIPVVNAEAATTKKVTMYVGEAFYTYVSGQKVKSVSSSDKNVVKASKDSDYKRQVNFTAKKAGKATITVKVKYKSRNPLSNKGADKMNNNAPNLEIIACLDAENRVIFISGLKFDIALMLMR